MEGHPSQLAGPGATPALVGAREPLCRPLFHLCPIRLERVCSPRRPPYSLIVHFHNCCKFTGGAGLEDRLTRYLVGTVGRRTHKSLAVCAYVFIRPACPCVSFHAARQLCLSTAPRLGRSLLVWSTEIEPRVRMTAASQSVRAELLPRAHHRLVPVNSRLRRRPARHRPPATQGGDGNIGKFGPPLPGLFPRFLAESLESVLSHGIVRVGSLRSKK